MIIFSFATGWKQNIGGKNITGGQKDLASDMFFYCIFFWPV